jgi:glycosyltransferase involved in cell wall biosynthesis
MRFSIATPCLNRVAMLPRMRASVLAQTGHDVQHVVVDGGSTDGSIAWLREEGGVQVIVAEGERLYASFNRAIAATSGDVVLLLNTDDELLPGALDLLARTFRETPGLDGIAAGAELVDLAAGTCIVLDHPRVCALRRQNCVSGHVLTNAKVFTRRALARIGPFDPRWRMMSDRDFMLRACALALRTTTVREPIYRFHMHEGSLTMQNAGRSRSIVREAIDIASVRLGEEAGSPLVSFYRSWHAFAVAYGAYDHILAGEVSGALGLVVKGWRCDPLFPARAIAESLAHWRERRLRRGRACAV